MDTQIDILENEMVDDLQYKGLRLIQRKDGFRFGMDAVLLANFADIKKGDRVIDLGTGTGIIAVLLAGKTEAGTVVGLEIQPEVARMAERSVRLNGLEDRVKIVVGDIKKCHEYFGRAKFNVVITNPPYIPNGGGLVNPSDTKAVSRHELKCTLEDVVAAGSGLLVPGGQFVMVHRPERIADIICLMRSFKLEPKYLRFVHPSPYKKPNLLLIKGMKGGRPELKMMAPLYIHDEKGGYSKEINEIYGREGTPIE
ncbi:MAG: tRNA1(Val) (adenine(37)-N6)-methyltransferase [Clostridiales bacterium]|nr:tRNA1(Val) (adenine(37)-N6)-methyltransferase [Eubacteriales bacterium]MDH7566105.1 tRNA1(Val) (adenine(37)-N6)-methyltransferase [Clostridiales bacterium]